MTPEISVVVPMRNEAPNVEQLYQELTSTLEAFGRPYEVLVIDDGSTDQTFALLAALQKKDPRLRVIRFAGTSGRRRRLRPASSTRAAATSSRRTATCRTIPGTFRR